MSYTQRLWISFGPAGLAVGALALLLVLRSHHDEHPLLFATLGLLAGFSFIGAGLVAWSRRPSNNTGRLMVAVGLTWFIGALLDANHPWVFTLGLALEAMFLAVFVHLLLAFPTGTLTRGERRLAIGGYVVAVLANVTWLLFASDPARGCAKCPPNKLLLSDRGTLATAIEIFWNSIAFVLVLAVVVVLLRRRRAATPAARRALGPVFVSGIATLVLLALTFALHSAATGASDLIGSIAQIAFMSVPYFFLAGLMRSRLARADVGRVFIDVPENPTPDELNTAFRRALRDPGLRLAHWLPERDTFLDLEGRAFEAPEPGRHLTLVEWEGRRVGALVHDPVLCEEPELLETAVATARIGLRQDRLQADLGERLLELQRSEAGNRALLDALPDMVFRLRRDGVYINYHVHDERDLFDPDVIGRSVYDRLPPQVAAQVAKATQRALDEGGIQTHEYALEHDGSTRHYEARVVASGPDEVVAIVREITDRKLQDEEIRRSRARIVEAADAERRRLERNLHDGAQQRLVSLSLALRLAQSKLQSAPSAAEQLLVDAQDELAHALEELRELARGIHPAILTDRGLDAALETLAARAPLPVEIEGLPGERLPGPVEAAAYYVVAEGLTNVVKYASASLVRVSVERRNGFACVEVVDDGIGGADPAGGTGLRGLYDRVEALDGRLEVESPVGGGTRLRAEIPVA